MADSQVNRRTFMAATMATALASCLVRGSSAIAQTASAAPMAAGAPTTAPIGRSLDITGNLTVLKKFASQTPNTNNTHSILLQHILPTATDYVDTINSVWPVDLVIAIVYSADPGTVEALRAKGYNVVVPPNIDYMLNDVWKDVVAHLQKIDYPIVIQEVGGYFADWTDELAKYPKFKGCVEDTKNGLWRYQAAARRKPLGVPVLSMAATDLKGVEDSLIGDACVYSLEKALRTQMASIIDGLRCGVVGWGNIGHSAASALKGRNAVVSLYDIDPVSNMLAYGRGLQPVPLAQLLQTCDIVIGCSGRRSIRVADLPDFKDGIVLCSASSKDIEIDLVGLGKLCTVENLTPAGAGMCPVDKYTVKENGKVFYVLDHGTPIDFLDKPLSGAILDCTYSELFVCMRDLVAHDRPAGLVELPIELQDTVAKAWLATHTDSFANAPKDKTFFYPESLDWE